MEFRKGTPLYANQIQREGGGGCFVCEFYRRDFCSRFGGNARSNGDGC